MTETSGLHAGVGLPAAEGSDEPRAASRDVVGQLAAALWDRVESQRRADDRLASFAFSEGPATGRTESPVGQPDVVVDWPYFVLRAFRVLSEPATLPVLDAVRGDGRSLDELVGLVGSGTGDRLAAVDRVGGLASAGLAIRELETDRVRLTPLGEALLDLVAEVARRAAGGRR